MERLINGISYTLQYKNVKNINLRISHNKTVTVSANPIVPVTRIDEFVYSKRDFIYRTLAKLDEKQNTPQTRYFDETEIRSIITKICRDVYPCYEKYGVKYPQIKFRKMVSQWGNCYPRKGILTFNTNLIYAPYCCIEYVVHHEFTHFIHPNHSSEFYRELEKNCPGMRKYRKMLKEISLR